MKTVKKIVAVFLVLVSLLSMIPFSTISVNAEGQTSITLKQGTGYAYTSGWTRTVVPMTADGEQVYCVQPDLPAPPNGTYRTDNGKLKEITSSNSNYMMYKKALYYCYGGDGFNTSNTAFKTDTTKHQAKYSGNTPSAFMGNLKWTTGGLYYTSLTGSNLHYMYTHLLLSYIYYGDSKYKSMMGNYVPYTGYYDQIKELYNAVKAAPAPDNSLKLFMLDIGSKYQKVIIIRDGVKLQLQKSNINSSVAYTSLAKAKYNIYLDSACTDYFGYITTDSSGFGKYGAGTDGIDVPLQNYYCKEVTAPKGFALDTTVYQFKKTGTTSNGTTIYKATVSDVPYVKLQLLKTSANPDITEDNPNYSLKGAVYTVYTDKDCTLSANMQLKTNDFGYACYKTGDGTNTDTKDKDLPLYKKNSGQNVTLKKGVTYYCKETEAPPGYKLDDTVYQFKDSGSLSSDGVKIFRAYSMSDSSEPSDKAINDPVGIILQKKNAITGETTNQGLGGAVFQIQYYSTVIDKDYDVSSGETAPALDSETLKRTWYIRTDEDGTTWLHEDYLADNESYVSDDFYFATNSGNPALPMGTVVIKEVEAPPGYAPSDITFYRPITEEKALIAEDTNTPLEVLIDEQPQNAFIGLHKMNNARQGVAGATYGLYSDSEATNLLSTLVTDSNGKGVFGYAAGVNKTFYIKEITAPAGYPLDTTVYPITPTEDNTTAETAVIQTIYEESIKGNILIKKSSNDGIVQNMWFAAIDNLGNEYNAVATDSKGEALITGLPVYDENGAEIDYTVKELGFKTTPGEKSYGGFTWTVKAEDCIYYKGAYYEGVANDTFSNCEYAYSRYYYGDKDTAIKNAAGYTKTLVANGTVTYSFVNTVPETDIEVYKDSYDGTKYGFWFTVKDQFDKSYGNIKTDGNGFASYSNTYGKKLPCCIKVPNSSICLKLSYRVEELGFKNPGSGSYYFPDNYNEKYVSDLVPANITNNSISFSAYNYPDTGEINIVKSSDDNDIEGLCFEISAYINDAAEDEEPLYYTTCMGYDSSGNEITSIILKTDSEGKVTTDSIELYDYNGNLMDGIPIYVFNMNSFWIDYKIVELGFDNGDGTYTFPDRYIEKEPVMFNLVENRSYTYKCDNSTVEPGKLQVIKTSEDNIVDGFWFNITATNYDYTINVVTGSDGTTPILELPIYVPATQGTNELITYTIKELGTENDDGTYSIPNRYTNPRTYTVTLDTTDEVKFVTIKNTLKKGSVNLYKQDSDGNKLTGSEWELYKSDGTQITLTQTGNGSYFPSSTGNVTTLSTDTNGKLYVYNLPQGDYYFIETKPALGFMPYAEKVKFSIVPAETTVLKSEVTVTDNNQFLSKTGGTGTNQYYLFSCSFLIAAIATITIYLKKEKRKVRTSYEKIF